MKTTLQLPDELMRRVKTHAIQRSQKLQDAVVELLGKGLAAESENGIRAVAPAPVRLKGRRLLTIRAIEAAIAKRR